MDVIAVEEVKSSGVEGYQSKAKKVYRPDSLAQLKELIVSLNEKSITYGVVSTGCNWGLGSRWTESEVLIELSQLKSIEWNEKFGVLTIEPGVTQQMVYEYLTKNNSNIF